MTVSFENEEKDSFFDQSPRTMEVPMQRFIIALVLALILAGTAGAAEHEDRHLLTVITDDSTQTQAMALILTRQWVKDGGSAQILLCDTAGGMAVTGFDVGDEAVQPPDMAPGRCSSD